MSTTNTPFLLCLFDMLKNHENVIHWLDDGHWFIIPNSDDFSKYIMPLYFKRDNFKSFLRQLNYYDFKRYKKKSSYIFYHHCFQKDRPDLLAKIKRKTNSKFKAPIKKDCPDLLTRIGNQTGNATTKRDSPMSLNQILNTPHTSGDTDKFQMDLSKLSTQEQPPKPPLYPKQPKFVSSIRKGGIYKVSKQRTKMLSPPMSNLRKMLENIPRPFPLCN